jgi:imidazolonepropionase-like amidohydrolase
VEYLLPDDFDLSETPAGFYGINVIGHVDEAKIALAARKTREAGAWVVPTLTWIANMATPANDLLALPEMAYVPPGIVNGWVQGKQRYHTSPELYQIENAPRQAEIRSRLVTAMRDEGVGLLLGTDSPLFFNVPGFSLHSEIDNLLAAGLTPYEVLQSGTVSTAVFLGAETEFGRIAPGLAADLLLVADDPFVNIETLRQPLGVMLRGRWLDREMIDVRLDDIAARYRKP